MPSYKKCDLLMEIYSATPKTDRLYWVMTELFVLLHEGDVCTEILRNIERQKP